jgi:hypothetical protein
MKAQHIWEHAGLGSPPFRFIRRERVPRMAAISCDYYGHTIQRLFWVRDKNGIEFKVGSECIKEAEPPGPLRRAADAALKDAIRAEQTERIAAAKARLAPDDRLGERL